MQHSSKVLVTILQQGWVRPQMIPMLGKWKADPRVQLDFAGLSERPYENNLNAAVKMVLDGGYDYWITFDHDNVPTKNPIDLIALDKDIIGMPYPTYRYNDAGKLEMAFLAMDKKENGEYLDHKITTGLQEVDAVASGALVIARRVLEHPDVYFEREWDRGIATRGVDFNFCDKAKAAGFKVFAHYDYPADHIKEMSLLSVLNFKYV